MAKAKAKKGGAKAPIDRKDLATINLPKELNEQLKKYKDEHELKTAAKAIEYMLENCD